MRILLFYIVLILFCFSSRAQQSVRLDSAKSLEEVTVNAYEQNKQLKEVAAAVNLIDKTQLDRFGNSSLLPAINSSPGIRMEERSPGSYRLNIRGSTLRSPFGVRNVKVYWNDIPFTDPGGNTYLNQLGFSNIQSIAIIKGPAGSIYGAGTGGAMLLYSQSGAWHPSVTAGYTGGSFNTHSIQAGVHLGSNDRRTDISYDHQSSDGYRYHTNMRRDIAVWQTQLKVNEKQELSTHFLYGDLYYQTPGALNLKEFTTDPKASRPAAGGLPSAEQSMAAIYQKMLLAGITNRYAFNAHWQNNTTVYGSFVQFTNPTFRTYEKRSEPQFGGRTVFTYHTQWQGTALNAVAGTEAQRGFFNTKDYKNKNGNPDSLQTDDDVNSWIYAVFLQADLKLPHNLDITVGASFNQFHVSDQRLSVPTLPLQQRTYNNELAPRLAVSKKIWQQVWVYGSIAKGFSPPAIAEVLPPSRSINTSLNAEKGINYEAGIKSNWFSNRLYVEVNAFYFRLQDAIVQRQDAGAANYYINAGNTRQKGLESQLAYQIFSRPQMFLNQTKLWIAHTWNNFRYDNFKQLNTDYSGKFMPSVARNTVAAGIDLVTHPGLYLNLTYFYSDPIAMNDAHTDFASSYHLLGGRLGYKKTLSKTLLNVYAGFDNLFNMHYSLGNDINAAAGRYYNAAPGRNFYAGISFQWKQKNQP